MDHSSSRRMSWRTALAVPALAVSALAAAVPSSWAQDAPVTRAAVKAELAELIAAGYNPHDRYHYPDNLWAAQRVVEQRRAMLAEAGGAAKSAPDATMSPQPSEAVGGMPDVKSEAGARARGMMSTLPAPAIACSHEPECSVYFGH